MTLADLCELCERFVPRESRHDNSIRGNSPEWWPAHELGHLIVAAPRDIGQKLFGLDDEYDYDDAVPQYSEHHRRCMELAAMVVSHKLLTAAGRPDLADDEREDTDTNTMYYEPGNGVSRILRSRRCRRIPRTKEGLVRLLTKRLQAAGRVIP